MNAGIPNMCAIFI